MKKVLTYLIVFGISIISFEIYLRYSGIVSPMDTTVNNQKDDRYFMKNKVSYTFKESFGILKTDNQNTITYPNKNTDSENINFFGTSMTVASEVFPRHHFGSYIANNSKYSVNNYAVHGMDIYSVFARYLENRENVKNQKNYIFISAERFPDTKYDPFFLVPDFTKNPITVKNKESKKSSLSKKKVYPFMQNSSLLTLANKVRSIISRGLAPSILLDKFYFKSDKNTEKASYKKPKINKDEILKMLEVWKNDNVKFVFLGNIETTNLNKEQIEFANECVSLLKLSGIEYFDFSKELPKDIPSRKAFYFHSVTKEYGHFNKDAHKYFAEKILPFIKD